MSTLRGFAALLFLAMVSACGGSTDVTTSAPVVGTLSVQVLGLDSASLDQGGEVVLVKTDVAPQTQIARAVPLGGLVEMSIPVGAYSVSYLPPNNYNTVKPSQNGATLVNVTANARTSLQFEVAGVPGVIGLNFNLVRGANPSTGGSASLVRSDGVNGTSISVTLAPRGVYLDEAAAVAVSPGTYLLTYTPPDGYELLPSTSYAMNANVGTASVVVHPARLVELLFAIAGK
jgi:hypothetical protein